MGIWQSYPLYISKDYSLVSQYNIPTITVDMDNNKYTFIWADKDNEELTVELETNIDSIVDNGISIRTNIHTAISNAEIMLLNICKNRGLKGEITYRSYKDYMSGRELYIVEFDAL